MKVFTYVIQFDGGAAPNYCEPATTLAICKPRIRRSAEVGDAIIAFEGSFLGPEAHAVRWAGVVTEKLAFSEYWNDRRFASKKPNICSNPDNIYRPMRDGFVQVPNNVHGPEEFAKDIGGEFVLVLGTSWRFGAAGPLMPEPFGLRMVGGRRAHRVHEMAQAKWMPIERWPEVASGTLERTDERLSNQMACGRTTAIGVCGGKRSKRSAAARLTYLRE